MKHAVMVVLFIPSLALGSTPVLVTDLEPGPADAGISSSQAAGTTLVFRREGLGLWRSDATEVGTTMLLDADTRNLTTRGDRVDFTRPGMTPSLPEELWSTDGTVANTGFVAALPPTISCALFCTITPENPNDLTPAGDDLLFFLGNTWAVWRSDGTTPGTAQIANYSGEVCSTGCLCCFILGGTLTPLAPVNKRVYYTGFDPAGSLLPLFVADASTLTEVLTGESIAALRGVRGRLFLVTSGLGPTTLLTHDGFGTRTIGVLGDGLLAPTQLTAAGGLLYLVLGEGTPTASLWRSDGTEAGTFELLGSDATALTAVGGRLFFRRLSAGNDELWTSDGTVSGTSLVLDLPPSHLTNVDGKLFFVTSDVASGEELWTSDGTPGGTALVADIVPGSGSSSPADLTAACGRLYFTANTPATGRELWALDLTPGVCDPVDEASCTSNADCDDGNACTTDVCNLDTGCTSTPNHAACNDGDPCSTDLCDVTNGCVSIPHPCCTANADCDDEHPCTDDACNLVTGECTSTPFACCSDTECDDDDSCTVDSCDPANGCASVLLPGLESVTCVLGATGSEAARCPGETIPARVGRRLDRIRALIDAAIGATRPLSAKNRVRSAVRRLDRLVVTIGREASHARITETCRQALTDTVMLARNRADAWYQSQ